MVLYYMAHLAEEAGPVLEHLEDLPGVIVYLEWEGDPGKTLPGFNLLPGQAPSYGLLRSRALLWSCSSLG